MSNCPVPSHPACPVLPVLPWSYTASYVNLILHGVLPAKNASQGPLTGSNKLHTHDKARRLQQHRFRLVTLLKPNSLHLRLKPSSCPPQPQQLQSQQEPCTPRRWRTPEQKRPTSPQSPSAGSRSWTLVSFEFVNCWCFPKGPARWER